MQLRRGLNSAADIIALRNRVALPTSGYIHLLHRRRIFYFFSQITQPTRRPMLVCSWSQAFDTRLQSPGSLLHCTDSCHSWANDSHNNSNNNNCNITEQWLSVLSATMHNKYIVYVQSCEAVQAKAHAQSWHNWPVRKGILYGDSPTVHSTIKVHGLLSLICVRWNLLHKMSNVFDLIDVEGSCVIQVICGDAIFVPLS